ncbi:MAG: sterol desaturase family protein [Acidimicrobiales bacterium]|nr:sterol desaturase family protein [Acidimicrobiales bacterium]RZV43719.1 MAG: fatty acid hydroxylase family protein [Acidimicrobiales bacterium]
MGKTATGERADVLRTRREILNTYLAHGSPRIMLIGLAVFLAIRIVVGGFGWVDLLMIAITATLLGFVEWVLHLYALHCPEGSWRMEKLGLGVSHQKHHVDPPEMAFILLAPVDAFVFQILIAGWTALWSIPVAWLVGGAIWPSFLTALTVAYASLAHYEWVHLMVHTKYRPKSRYYRRLSTNHRLHHYRNEYYWLGVTSNLGDRVLRTYPADKSDVPLSATARTLGQ